MYWDRFDICEAYNLLAHDWGLYDVKARLDNIPFRCAPAAEFYEAPGWHVKHSVAVYPLGGSDAIG
jgi:hypothetical protein